MKIIKEGKVKPVEVTCPNCECVMEITKRDTYIGPVGRFLKCPCCDEILYTDYFNKLNQTNAYPVKEEN